MLILSRRKGESLLIGDTVEITVLAIEGGHVRLGIRAPEEVTVYRRELFETIRAENQQSASAGVDELSRALTRDVPTPALTSSFPFQRSHRNGRPGRTRSQ